MRFSFPESLPPYEAVVPPAPVPQPGTILITGAAGFIGSILVSHLNQLGWGDLILVDDVGCDERYRNLSGLRFADYWSKQECLDRIQRGCRIPALQAIVHLGACSATTERDASYLMVNNFAYTRHLAEFCLRRGIHFVYASSAATYGDGTQGFEDNVEALPRLRPLNKYAFSKHAFDLWALSHGAFMGANGITGLKYFNVFGPNEYHKGDMRSMVLKAYEQIQTTGKVRLFKSYHPGIADGEQTRDFIYVMDAAAATAWFLEHPEAAGIYNVGSGITRSWNDLANAVFTALGRKPQIQYIEMPEAIRPCYQYTTCADVRRLRASGCPSPTYSLEEGVTDYVRNYLSTTDIYLRG